MDILFVDDNLLMQQVVTRFLETRGYRVVVAGRGDDAIVLAQHHRPRLLLLDLNLPDTTGEDMLRALHTTAGCAGLPAIALSGLDSAAAAPLLEQGFAAYLQKPFDLDDLDALVRVYVPPPAARHVGE